MEASINGLTFDDHMRNMSVILERYVTFSEYLALQTGGRDAIKMFSAANERVDKFKSYLQRIKEGLQCTEDEIVDLASSITLVEDTLKKIVEKNPENIDTKGKRELEKCVINAYHFVTNYMLVMRDRDLIFRERLQRLEEAAVILELASSN